MPFLHWFKKKSRNTEAEGRPSGSREIQLGADHRPRKRPLKTRDKKRVPEATSTEQRSASPPAVPLSATAAPQQPASATAEPAPSPHFSVPVGAFYSKLPPHLLAPETPDLTRLIEISEEDVVIEQGNSRGVIPLSILSLSCPDIFVRPIASSDEIPITFPVESPVVRLRSPSRRPKLRRSRWRIRIQARESGNAEVPAGISAEGAPASATSSAGFEFSGPADSAETEIRLRLKPILSNFPPDLEQPPSRP